MANTAALDFFAGIRSDGVQNATGRDWQSWFALLDREDASRLSRQEIAALLEERQGLDGWWSRRVAAGYEQARFRQGWKRGEHRVDIHCTLPGKPEVVFQAWVDDGFRQSWLPDETFLVRKASYGRELRITWSDGSSLLVRLQNVDRGRCALTLSHVLLASTEACERYQAFWQAALGKLVASLLAGNTS